MKRLGWFVIIVVGSAMCAEAGAKSYANQYRDSLKKSLPEWNVNKQRVANCFLGFSLYPRTRVSRVDQTSYDEGMRQNDIILRVDGIAVASRGDFNAAYENKVPDENLLLEISRFGRPHKITVRCRDGTRYVNAVQAVYDAILKKKWDDCTDLTNEVQRIAGSNDAFIAALRNNCKSAGLKISIWTDNRPDYYDANLAYTARRLALEEAVGSEDYLDEIRPDVFKAIDFLESWGFRRLAVQLEKELQEAEDATSQLLTHQPKTPRTQIPKSPTIASSGTCFFIDAFGTAVTNHHVIEGFNQIEIIASNGSKSSAKVVRASDSIDAAVLATGLSTPAYLSLSVNGPLSLGQDVFTIGYPATNILGDTAKYSEGTVSALNGLNNDDSWIQISTPIQPGSSGGPLVNEQAQLVGIVTATAAVEKFFAVTGSLPQNINWAIKADYVRPLIPDNPQGRTFSSKQEAIAHTEKAICQVVAY